VIDKSSEESTLQNINAPRKGREDVDKTVYKSG
jgi:hypothetical protein